MINASSVNKKIARKKGYVRMAHNIYHISTEKNGQTSKKQKKANDLNDSCVLLLNCHFQPLVSEWGLQNSRCNSRFETKARKSVLSAVQFMRKTAVQKKLPKCLLS